MTVSIYSSLEPSRFCYLPDQQQFVFQDSRFTPDLLGVGERRTAMYRERFLMIQQQLFKDERFLNGAVGANGQVGKGWSDSGLGLFGGFSSSSALTTQNRTPSLLAMRSDDRFEITPVESLPGNPGIKFVFGMLTKVEENRLSVEGLSQAVALDLSKACVSRDFICEGSFVLLKGVMEDTVFRVKEITLPVEPRREFCDLSKDWFTGEAVHSIAFKENNSIAVLSEIHLDRPSVLAQLDTLFSGYENAEAIPSAYVLIGNFLSSRVGVDGALVRAYQRAFEDFGRLLAKHPETVRRSRIIMIPGSQDPGCGRSLPQAGLSDFLTYDVRQRYGVMLASNPVRIKLGDREVVIMSGGLAGALKRRRIVGQEDHDVNKMVARAVINQMHLWPVNDDRGVIWDWDNALRLYPVPHAIFLAEGKVSNHCMHAGCHFSTVGAFGKEGAFFLYSPSQQSKDTEVELSKLSPIDEESDAE